MLYRIMDIPDEKKFLKYVLQRSKYVSFCSFKSDHKKFLAPSYYEFLERIEKFKFDPVRIEYARYQHYRSGQKFHYYTLTDELKEIILSYSLKDWNYPTLLEDIAFYNAKEAWFFIISHEDMIFLNTDFPKLIEDILDMGIKLS